MKKCVRKILTRKSEWKGTLLIATPCARLAQIPAKPAPYLRGDFAGVSLDIVNCCMSMRELA